MNWRVETRWKLGRRQSQLHRPAKMAQSDWTGRLEWYCAIWQSSGKAQGLRSLHPLSRLSANHTTCRNSGLPEIKQPWIFAFAPSTQVCLLIIFRSATSGTSLPQLFLFFDPCLGPLCQPASSSILPVRVQRCGTFLLDLNSAHLLSFAVPDFSSDSLLRKVLARLRTTYHAPSSSHSLDDNPTSVTRFRIRLHSLFNPSASLVFLANYLPQYLIVIQH